MRALRLLNHLGAAAMVLAVAAPARAELRISDLDVFLNDHEVTVHVVLLGVLPGGLHEGIQSGIPAHVRLDIELWQYQRVLPDRMLVAKTVERTLTYNLVTREFKVAALKGEARLAHTTRDLRDAQRVLSDIRGVKMMPVASLDPAAVIYVRVNATTALNGENTFLARMNGTAEQTSRQSDYRTIQRVQ
jgi:Domain of unknown function (DUF4390)